jgi:hypothetical protein
MYYALSDIKLIHNLGWNASTKDKGEGGRIILKWISQITRL